MGSRTGHTTTRRAAERPSWLVRLGHELVEDLRVILICSIAILFLRGFLFQQSDIPSGSMEDTILVGDYLLVNRFIFSPADSAWERSWLPVRPIRRGDVVVFKHPDQPEVDFIKRVIGLPGETIELRDGRLYVDGIELFEPYVGPLYVDGSSYGPVRIEQGEYFMMGDHRNRSLDSRAWGTVPGEMIRGRAFLIALSTSAPPKPDSQLGRVTLFSAIRKPFDLIVHARWDRAFRPLR